MDDWIFEIDLDPDAHPVSMGTRRLGDRPWLVADEHEAAELALKASLCAERHDEVFVATDDALGASREVTELLMATGVDLMDDTSLHPLDRAGRSVQEDLVLMHRTDAGWILAAASLCFPSRWRLADKIGRDSTAIHAPVDGYRERIATRVTSAMDALGSTPVLRRNWFLHADRSLFQPTRPSGGNPLVAATRCRDEMFFRSERQTLRALATPGWVLFTIKTQQATFGDLADARPSDIERWLQETKESLATYRGVTPAQRAQLLASL